MVTDDESPPGAWKNEMERMPWGFGQRKKPDVEECLWIMRKHGLTVEANILAAEIAGLQAEIERVTR